MKDRVAGKGEADETEEGCIILNILKENEGDTRIAMLIDAFESQCVPSEAARAYVKNMHDPDIQAIFDQASPSQEVVYDFVFVNPDSILTTEDPYSILTTAQHLSDHADTLFKRQSVVRFEGLDIQSTKLKSRLSLLQNANGLTKLLIEFPHDRSDISAFFIINFNKLIKNIYCFKSLIGHFPNNKAAYAELFFQSEVLDEIHLSQIEKLLSEYPDLEEYYARWLSLQDHANVVSPM